MHPFNRREIARRTGGNSFLQKFFKTQEIQKIKDLKPIRTEDILNGGMPTVCLGEVKNRSLWFKGYEQTYLERDVREINQIENLIAFRNLLHLTALRTGQLLSPSQLGRDSKLTAVTTSRYLSLFETSFIITRLSPYLRNRASRLIKSPKIYISDSGLACYLAGVERFEYPSSEPILGAMLETYIAQNLSSLINGRWTEAHLYFWSIQGRYEVDFVIEAGNQCIALEIKSGTRWQDKDLYALKAFLKTTPHCKAAILGYNGTDSVRLGEKLWPIPLSLILS
jgi:predicted AAA+ superfamily ATPase